MENKAEIWKAHPEYAGIEVSTFGMVRSVKGCYYKISLSNKGYLQVVFRMKGKCVSKLVHRLVAQAFIPNPDNLPQINHKDCDRTNNNVSNLEWCNASYNNQYREKYGISNTESLGVPVFAINLTNLKVSRYQSQNEAGRELGFGQGNISNVIKGKQKQAHGYWFVMDDGHAVDIVKSKLHDIGKTGLKI